jgi:hypothetical protein
LQRDTNSYESAEQIFGRFNPQNIDLGAMINPLNSNANGNGGPAIPARPITGNNNNPFL